MWTRWRYTRRGAFLFFLSKHRAACVLCCDWLIFSCLQRARTHGRSTSLPPSLPLSLPPSLPSSSISTPPPTRTHNTHRAYGIPEPILQRAQALGHAFDTACRPPSSSPLPPLAPSTPTCAPAPPTLAGATTVLQRLYSSSTAAEPDARAAVAVVAPGFDPSPALEGRSCVYLLCVPPPPPRTSDMGEGARTPTPPPSSFYVGETESVRRRLEQHRCVCVSVPVCVCVCVCGQNPQIDAYHTRNTQHTTQGALRPPDRSSRAARRLQVRRTYAGVADDQRAQAKGV